MSPLTVPRRRFAFHVEYDGTQYFGWQRQKHVRPTIQECLEDVLEGFFGTPCPIQGASRTDAGVHAKDQVAAVTFAHPIRPEGFVKAINARLPDDISIRNAQEIPLDFNPRFNNAGKTYHYHMYRSAYRKPLLERHTLRLQWDLDISRMREASRHLVGTYDFRSFAATDGQQKTTVRTVTQLTLSEYDDQCYRMCITGTAFLKHMVRNIVGTLIDVGRDKLAPDDIAAILAARDRTRAGPTAPAHGLCLEHVYMNYDDRSIWAGKQL